MTKDTEKKKAFKLFTPPFRYDCGYIWDAKGNMVADDPMTQAGDDESLLKVLQIRGWGRLIGGGAMNLSPEEAAKIQDAAGELMAEALTEYWEKKPLVNDLVEAALKASQQMENMPEDHPNPQVYFEHAMDGLDKAVAAIQGEKR